MIYNCRNNKNTGITEDFTRNIARGNYEKQQ